MIKKKIEMNSKYMIINTNCLPFSIQIDWWKDNKEIYLYPKMWDDIHPIDLGYFQEFLNVINEDEIENKLKELITTEKGVMYMVSNCEKGKQEKEKIKVLLNKIDRENPNTNNRCVLGDELLYDTPLASLDDDTNLWYCFNGEDVEDVYKDFCDKYVLS